MDWTYTIVDWWGALLLRVGTGGYLETWFLTAPFVLLLGWAQWRGGRRLREVGEALEWTVRDAEDLSRVRGAIAHHLKLTAARGAVWIAGLAALVGYNATLDLRFDVALSHVVALILLPTAAFAAHRRFVERFRALEVLDPAAREVYEDWLTQWSGPNVRLRAPEPALGAVSVVGAARGDLSEAVGAGRRRETNA